MGVEAPESAGISGSLWEVGILNGTNPDEVSFAGVWAVREVWREKGPGRMSWSWKLMMQ